MPELVTQVLKSVIGDASIAASMLGFTTPLDRSESLSAQDAIGEVRQSDRFVVDDIHKSRPVVFDGSEKRARRVRDVNPVGEALTIAGTCLTGKTPETLVQVATWTVKCREPQDAHALRSRCCHVLKQLFGVKQHCAVLIARLCRGRFIHPAAISVSVDRAAAGIHDLCQLRQLWNKQFQAVQTVEKGLLVSDGIHLAIPFWSKADHRHIGVDQRLVELIGLAGIADQNLIRQWLQVPPPFFAGGRESELSLAVMTSQFAGQNHADITATHDRQAHRDV